MSSNLERTSFDLPTLPRVETLLSELRRGVLRIPQFQRPSVWDDDQRIQLLDSIIKGLPIGSLMVWRTTNKELAVLPSLAGIPVQEEGWASVEKAAYVIDGHQRLSTLYGALTRYTGERTDGEEERWPLYYVLGEASNPQIRRRPQRGDPVPGHWLPMDILLDEEALDGFLDQLKARGHKELVPEARAVRTVFKDTIIPVVPLVTNDLDLVTDAFVRINSQGTPMSEAHMLRALTFQKGEIATEQIFSTIREALPEPWAELPDQVMVHTLKVMFDLDVYRAGVREVYKGLREAPQTPEVLQRALGEAVEVLEDLGVPGWKALPYAYQLVLLAALAARHPGRLREHAVGERRWLSMTTSSEWFTGATGAWIRDELGDLTDMLSSDADRPESWRLISFAPGSARWRGAPRIRTGLPPRGNSVRAKAFQRFLALHPTDPEARLRRLALLADGEALKPLFSGVQRQPANLVLASSAELKQLRADLRRGQLSAAQRDEFCIPPELDLAASETHILRHRATWLEREELRFTWEEQGGDPTQFEAWLAAQPRAPQLRAVRLQTPGAEA